MNAQKVFTLTHLFTFSDWDDHTPKSFYHGTSITIGELMFAIHLKIAKFLTMLMSWNDKYATLV